MSNNIRNIYLKTRHHLGFFKGDFKYLKNLKLPNLSSEEKNLLKDTWPIDYIWNRIYKKENGFSPFMLGPMQNFQLQLVTNPYEQTVSLENKSMGDVFFPDLQFPKAYVRCINGILYNLEMTPDIPR